MNRGRPATTSWTDDAAPGQAPSSAAAHAHSSAACRTQQHPHAASKISSQT